MLSDSDDDSGEVVTQLIINEHYAKAFEYKKEREELEKLKAKYGSDAESSGSDISTDSESAESEDEDGEELTPAVDVAILRTLYRIKNRDPEIYRSDKNIFGEEQKRVSNVVPDVTVINKLKDKSRPVYLRQVAIDTVLNPSRTPSPEPLPPVQEQKILRDETIAAFHTAVNEEDDDLLIPREKTKDEIEKEEEEYRALLAREVGDLRNLITVEKDAEIGNVDEAGEVVEQQKKRKRKRGKKDEKGEGEEEVGGNTQNRKSGKSKAEQDQEFLMNYILNRGWIDRSAKHVPTYKEVTSSKIKSKHAKDKDIAQENSQENLKSIDNHEDLDELDYFSDSSFNSLASHFESSYNHRFEEPEAAHIPSFPRSLPSLVRRPDTTRKDARERRKERKAAEIEKRREEVRRMKALKMRELRRKLEKIGKEGGLDTENLNQIQETAIRDLDLEGEWDGELHDQRMAELFGGQDELEDYELNQENGPAEVDSDGKPHWDDDIDIGDIVMVEDDAIGVGRDSLNVEEKGEKKKRKKKKKGGEGEAEGVAIDEMDADQIRVDDGEEWDGTEEMRRKKLDEYMDEIYGMDFNDMVGDLPTRFKYVPVQPQSYSLTPVEILYATDKELNEYMSVKKYAPYKDDSSIRKWDRKRQETLQVLKMKIAERMGREYQPENNGFGGQSKEGEGKAKKRPGKQERMKIKAVVENAEEGKEDEGSQVVDDKVEQEKEVEEKTRKRKKRRKMEPESEVMNTKVGNDDSNVHTEPVDGTKKKRRRRKPKKNDGGEVVS